MEPIALDIETSGLKLADCEILGLSVCAEYDYSAAKWYPKGEKLMSILDWLHRTQHPVTCHNGLFDISFIEFKYPQYQINMVEDTACLCLMADNSDASVGYSLDENANKYLGQTKDDSEIIEWLRANGFDADAKNFRGMLEHVPLKLVGKYCKFDSYLTKGLSNIVKNYIKVPWQTFMQLFIAEFKIAKEATMNGVPLNMENLAVYEKALRETVATVTYKFFNNPEMQKYIDFAQREAHYLEFMKRFLKSTRGSVKERSLEDFKEKYPFNINSGDQLIRLFNSQQLFFNWDKGEFEYPELTDKGNPTLDGDHIGLYGTGGEILEELGNAKSILVRIEAIYSEIECDGVWRPSYNLTGARSGRISTSGSNILAFPVKEKLFASCIEAPEGELIMVADFKALEPTIQAHITGDDRLRYCVYDGIGKKPFYDKEGILWIDDIYLHAASYDPVFKKQLNVDLDNWLINPDEENEKNKPVRSPNKIVFLSTSYGLSKVATLRKQLIKGTKRNWTDAEIQPMIRNMRVAFPKKHLAVKALEEQVKIQTYLTTEFGFPLTFASVGSSKISTAMHKTFNRKVQGTAAGVMKTYQSILLQNKPSWFKIIVPDWHDAYVCRIPEDKRDEAKELAMDCLATLNALVKWEIPFRLSVGFGRNLYAAKG